MGMGGIHSRLARQRQGPEGEGEVVPRKRGKKSAHAETSSNDWEELPASRDPVPGDGPPHFRLRGSLQNDEWQTAAESWAAVSGHFAAWKTNRVWQPFYYDGQCACHLRSLGFTDVVHDDTDFFTRVQDKAFMDTVDLIWDNPPYTTKGMKERILSTLAPLGKPFALLLPASVLHSQFLRSTLDPSRIQVIVVHKVYVRKSEGERLLPFKCLVWLCYDLRLPRDLVFI